MVSIKSVKVKGWTTYLSSCATSREPRRRSPGGSGGGEDDGPGEIDFCREERRDVLDGVRYGVSVGVGSEAAAAAANSSSVSHSVMLYRWADHNELDKRSTLKNFVLQDHQHSSTIPSSCFLPEGLAELFENGQLCCDNPWHRKYSLTRCV